MATPLETPLMTALSAQTWHRTLSSSVGRDKLFRLVQYTCKLVRGFQAGRGTPEPRSAAARVLALEAALGSSRQMWRLLKWVSIYARPHRRPSPGAGLREVAKLVADAALFAYLVLDNVAFVRKSKVLPGDAAASTRRAARFWLLSVLASGSAAAHALREALHTRRALRRQLKADDATPAQRRECQATEARVLAHSANLAKHCADSVVAASLASTSPLHPGVIGAFGAVSSAVGLWEAWPRHVSTG